MSTEDHVCNTHLWLGLGSQRMYENEARSVYQGKKPCFGLETSSPSFEPFLTLGLPNDTYQAMEESIDVLPQVSPQSNVSSFFDTREKRERDMGSEQMMDRRVTSDEYEEGNARKKLRLTKEQSALLEESFRQNNTLNPKQKQTLAKKLNLRPRQVEVWFQNRRARTKLKQTELDYEYLKKCCEALTHENKRLQRELHEVKSVNVAPQLYMHLPATTLAMCPSCERISGGGISNTSSKTSCIVLKEPHLH